MNILYGIQGTGHGHLSRAKELLPELSKYGSIDILMSGYNHNLDVAGNVVFRKRGLSLIYDQNGSVSISETVKNIDLVRFVSDVTTLSLDKYNLIISDFEPVTSWAAQAGMKKCVGISHQASFHSTNVPRPSHQSLLAEKMLEKFAPAGFGLGFHYRRYDHFIEPPLIRKEIRELKPISGDHITVYLPSYDHQTLENLFQPIGDIKWEIFSPYCHEPTTRSGHILIHPVDNERFLKSVESSLGVIAGAGFELSSEAMYLGKKLLVVPILNQYEQLCNATALAEMGVSVVQHINRTFTESVKYWIKNGPAMTLPEIADPADVARRVVHQEYENSLLDNRQSLQGMKLFF